jgi:hypothetical protein
MVMIVNIFFVVGVLCCAYMLARNHAVLSERMKMSRLVFNEKEWEKYLMLKHTVSYDKMMTHFWIWPIHKMWPEELQKLRAESYERTDA